MARCVTFAVARIRVRGLPLEVGEILHIFPSGTESMGDRGSKKAYTGPRTGIYLPTKFGCDRSIVSYLVSYLVWPHKGPISMRPRALRTMQDP